MTIFLINAEIVCYVYMGKTRSRQENHIVEAETEDAAREKIRAHYKAKDDEYNVTYYVDVNYINELIK